MEIPSIINPAIRLIFLLFLVRKLMTVWLHWAEIIENNNRGRAIPIPKKIKLSKLVVKLIVEVLIANKTIRDAGLHGKTMAPKKKPKRNEVRIGFLAMGALTFGKNLEKSRLNIRNILTTAKIPNAMGEIIPMAFVREACKNLVKINPTKNMEDMTPRATIRPRKINDFLASLPFLSEN